MNLEHIDRLNDWLKETYGLFDNAEPNYRIVFSDDQYEYRKGTFAKYDLHGNLLGYETEVKYVPKYKQWIQHKYVLEMILPVPDINNEELVSKTSYEPLWVFEDARGNALPPKREAIILIIRQQKEQLARVRGIPIYKDPESNPEEALEIRKKNIERLERELFGNETTTGDGLAQKRAIVVPGVN